MIDTVTEDQLLGGRVVLRQPAGGFRAAIDPVFLAAAVPAQAGEHVLELGAGTGAASLCLARRVEGARVAGLELQPDLAGLAAGNAVLNVLAHRGRFAAGDLLAPPADLIPGSFDHVMANPPYLEAGTATLPTHGPRALAVGEGAADLEAWVRVALSMVRPRGSVTFVHRADRTVDLLAALQGKVGEIVLFPLWPAEGKPAKRVLIRARKGIQTPMRVAYGLVLHGPDGRFTAAADRVLRDGEGLVL